MRPGLLAPSAMDDLRLDARTGADDEPRVVDRTLVADLGLDRLLRIMAAGDTYVNASSASISATTSCVCSIRPRNIASLRARSRIASSRSSSAAARPATIRNIISATA